MRRGTARVLNVRTMRHAHREDATARMTCTYRMHVSVALAQHATQKVKHLNQTRMKSAQMTDDDSVFVFLNTEVAYRQELSLALAHTNSAHGVFRFSFSRAWQDFSSLAKSSVFVFFFSGEVHSFFCIGRRFLFTLSRAILLGF
jgi:hypothetical protein